MLFFFRGVMHNEDLHLGSNLTPFFSRCAMLLNAQISGIRAATQKLTYDFVVHITPI